MLLIPGIRNGELLAGRAAKRSPFQRTKAINATTIKPQLLIADGKQSKM